MAVEVETYLFEAETRELLNLMVHSLYTTKDIALRELISNASDALDRLRFESLTRRELLGNETELEIRLVPDSKARTLTISDTGIGMSRKEVISDLGTIARSGTREFRKLLLSGKKLDDANRLIDPLLSDSLHIWRNFHCYSRRSSDIENIALIAPHPFENLEANILNPSPKG
jgi:HSP90 family molecular chaperone